MIEKVVFWFGALHVAAYALAGFSFASTLFVNWIVRRFRLKADLMRAAHRMFQERRDRRLKAEGRYPA